MAVVVKIDEEGQLSYKSANQGLISDEQKNQAKKLNDLVKQEVVTFVNKNKLKDVRKNRFHFYWEFGNMLRDIYDNSGLVAAEEKELFFENVRMHMDALGEVFPKDDKKRRRNIPKQFYKLAGYPYDVAKTVEWSQWSYLFDNTYLMESTGFDEWFKGILESGKYKFNESYTRLWAESFNLLFKKVDLSDWSEEEFLKPLICTLDVINNLVKAGVNIESREIRKKTKSTILSVLMDQRKEFILMQMGQMDQKKFVDTITKLILLNLNRK
jgi:hypothetical protein